MNTLLYKKKLIEVLNHYITPFYSTQKSQVGIATVNIDFGSEMSRKELLLKLFSTISFTNTVTLTQSNKQIKN